MVEKFSPATNLANSKGALGATGGILKKAATQDNNGIPSIEQRDSGDSLSIEKPQVGVKEETAKFRILCEGVQNQLALFQVAMVELLALKDELIQHALPPSLLVKIALVTSKLFRGASDFAVPVTELVRLVKLYSAPWESKSAALKKLHEDYENKQRQLNVALQKLVLVGIQADKMAQERRVLNWERLFTRIMTSKAHGFRWKFLIDSFKKKIKTGEIYEAGASTDEEAQKKNARNERKLEHIKRRTMNKETTPQRIMKEVVTIEGAKQSLASAPEGQKAVKSDGMSSDEENISDIDIGNVNEDDKSIMSRHSSAEQSRKETKSPVQLVTPSKTDKPKIRFSFKAPSDDDDDDDDSDDDKPRHGLQFKHSRQQPKKPGRTSIKFSDEKPRSRPKPKVTRGVKFFDPSDDEDDVKTKQKASTPVVSVPKVVTEDKQCWTHEPDCERFLHIRLYRPECKKVEDPCCTVVFMGAALKTNIYEQPQSNSDEDIKPDKKENDVKSKIAKGGKASVMPTESSKGKPDVNDDQSDSNSVVEQALSFEELLFKLPDTNGYAPGEKPVDISDEQVKFAVHPSPEEPMVAMAAVKYSDLKVLDQFEGRWSHTDYSHEIQKFPLLSTMSDREMPFGSECGHIPMVCYMSKVENPKMLTKETETESFEQLVHNQIQEIRKAEEQEREETMRGVSPPVYTESELQSLRDIHTEELQALHSEYEKRLNELSQGLDAYSGNEEEMREFVHAATSPLFLRSPSPGQRSPSLAQRSQSPIRSQTSLSFAPSQTSLQQQSQQYHPHQQQQHVPRPPSDGRLSSRKGRPKIPNLPAWGKDLPQDFMVRLEMFNENSEKYRNELEEKTKRAIQQKYELQMAVQNRLNIPDDEQMNDDVCLPAVFMPTKTGLVFTPKAHSYFHPPGSTEGRLTQPPSMFKLPHLGVANQLSVLNLLNTGERYIASQSEKIPTSPLPQTAPPPPTSFDLETSYAHPGRACTR